MNVAVGMFYTSLILSVYYSIRPIWIVIVVFSV